MENRHLEGIRSLSFLQQSIGRELLDEKLMHRMNPYDTVVGFDAESSRMVFLLVWDFSCNVELSALTYPPVKDYPSKCFPEQVHSPHLIAFDDEHPAKRQVQQCTAMIP
jgi:hypothetical protein